MQHQARGENRHVADGGACCRIIEGRAAASEGAEVDGEVEVGAGEGLDEGEPEEEVPGRDPRFGDDVFAE